MKKGFIGLLILILCAWAQYSFGATSVSGRPAPGGAAAASGITYSTAYTGTYVSGDTITATVSYSAGDLVIVAFGWDDNGVLSTLSDGTNSYTLQAQNQAYGSLNTRIAWCKIGTSQTNATLTATFTTASPSDGRFTALVFTGTFPTDPVDKYVAANGNSATPQITSGTLSQAVEAVVVVTHSDSNTRTFTADTTDGFTEVSDSGGTSVQYKITAATTSLVVDSAINSSDYWGSTLGSYKNE